MPAIPRKAEGKPLLQNAATFAPGCALSGCHAGVVENMLDRNSGSTCRPIEAGIIRHDSRTLFTPECVAGALATGFEDRRPALTRQRPVIAAGLAS